MSEAPDVRCVAAEPSAGNETGAVTVCSAVLFREARGVCSRHSALAGVDSAQAGSRTRRSRCAQPPPIAPARFW